MSLKAMTILVSERGYGVINFQPPCALKFQIPLAGASAGAAIKFFIKLPEDW